MKRAVFLLVLAGVLGAAVLCEEGTGLSGDYLRFYNFVVEGPEEPAVGDEITVEFTLRNVGKETIALGEKGVFAVAESEAGKERFGYTARDEWLSELESVSFSGTFTLGEAGEWSMWPSYQLKDGTYGPDYWADCSFEVEEEEAGVPDLRITDVWGYGDVPGVYTEIRYIITNAGNGSSGPSTTRIYLDGRRIKDDDVAGLRAGESRVESFAFEGECSGETDDFSAVADWEEEVAESNEENNEYQRRYECPEISRPDLVVENLSFYGGLPCEPFDYSQGWIRFVVRNAGERDAAASGARIYIDGNWTGSVSIPLLRPGEAFSATYRRSGMCSGQEDRLRVAVDVEGRVTESNESNNEANAAIGCTNVPLLPPDLRIKNITLVNESGGMKLVRYVIVNSGQDYACGSESGLYVDGALISAGYMGPLAPSGEATGEFPVRYGWESCNGTSDVIEVAADYAGLLNESNEENNRMSVEVPCPARPDLAPRRVSYYPPGRVAYTIDNNGSAKAPASRVKITISGNGIYRELEGDVPEIISGDWQYGEFSGVTLGSVERDLEYTFTIDVDYGNAIDEGDKEGNNWASTNISVVQWCRDGAKNGEEEEVDCGGPHCVPCDICNAPSMPSYFDWREWKGKNWVSPVKNQRNCGSCWAFAAIGTMEAAYIIEDVSYLLPDFSEQALISCSEAGTCFGGRRDISMDFLKINGTVTEGCLPYQSERCITLDAELNRVCTARCNCTTGLLGCRGACGCNYCQSPTFWKIREYYSFNTSDPDVVKRNIACHGPLFAASPNWQHAFVLVGWDDQNESWIIKNSWGSGWRDHGFGMVPYAGHNYSDLITRPFYYVEGVYYE